MTRLDLWFYSVNGEGENMKKVLIILTVMLLLAFTLTFFACNKEPVFAPNGICVSENFIFFPEERNDLHNAELREAFEKYLDVHTNLDATQSYTVYNFLNEEISEKYDLDIFEIQYHKNTTNRILLKHRDCVHQLCEISVSSIGYITNCAITDINNDGYVEILVALVLAGGTNYSKVAILDTKTDLLKYKGFKDKVIYLKENDDNVVSFYAFETSFYPNTNTIRCGVLSHEYFEKESILAFTPELNATKFNFKETSLTASCDVFSVVVQVEDVESAFPYLIEDKYRKILAYVIKIRMTYLGEPFTYVSNGNYVFGAMPKLVKNEKPVSASSITPLWFPVPTKHTITTGMEIDSYYDIYPYSDTPYEVGVYDLILTYGVNEPGGTYEEFGEIAPVSVYGQIIIEDFLTVTR